MEDEKQQLEALQDIRRMMKESSKFLSLSGLSGVFAGVYALAGAYLGREAILKYMHTNPILGSEEYLPRVRYSYSGLLSDLISICIGVLILSLTTALVLSGRKAKRTNQRLFDHTSIKLFWTMAVPLLTGGILCIALSLKGDFMMMSAIMLLFYGMALLNSSKYTMTDIKYLGYLEIVLGLCAAFYPGHGLLFWALGFGVLHIIYGSIMWFKYDREP